MDVVTRRLLSLSLGMLFLCSWTAVGRTATITVNSESTGDVGDGELNLTEAILLVNGELGRDLTPQEAAQVVGTVGNDDRIEFAIPGVGPHLIDEPEGGFVIRASDVTIDGYTQPGASPNTNSILDGNNAVIQIGLDARNGNHTGDGLEGDILTILGGNVVIEGLSFLSSFPIDGVLEANYGVNFRAGSVGGRVSGCWIGLHPDGETVAGGEIGLGADSTGGGHVFGTNGDGVDDRREFNVIVGFNVNAILEGAQNVKISGNYIGVMPDGLSPIPQEARDRIGEGDALEGGDFDGLVFGTDGDDVADAEERNIVGGMTDEDFQPFYGANAGTRISGNYFGVGVDGVTPLPCEEFLDPGSASLQGVIIGSDLDGVSDAIEGNVIANHTQSFLRFPSTTLVSFRGNALSGNTGEPFYRDVGRTFHSLELMREGNLAPVIVGGESTISGESPVITEGREQAQNLEIDIYVADPDTAGTHPQGKKYLASLADNGPEDMDGRDGFFEFDVGAFAADLLGGSIVVTDNVTALEDLFLEGVETSQFSNPVRVGGGQVPGDCNQDGKLDISDGICLLGHLFLGAPAVLPCGDGNVADPPNALLLDGSGDEKVDLSDAIGVFNFLFLGGQPPVLGTDCLSIPGCSSACGVAP